MKTVPIDGDKFRIIVMFKDGDFQPQTVKVGGKRFHKAGEIKLKSSEKELWDEGYVYQRRKWEG